MSDKSDKRYAVGNRTVQQVQLINHEEQALELMRYYVNPDFYPDFDLAVKSIKDAEEFVINEFTHSGGEENA